MDKASDFESWDPRFESRLDRFFRRIFHSVIYFRGADNMINAFIVMSKILEVGVNPPVFLGRNFLGGAENVFNLVPPPPG